MTLRIKEHRLKHGWTLEHLSAVSGLSRGFLSQIENGRRNTSTETLQVLADAFGCQIAALYQPDPSSDPAINEIINGVERLSPQNRQIVFDLISALQQKQGDQ